MFDHIFPTLIQPAQTKIILLVMDGLGGLPREPGGKTELETAATPHLDALAARSSLGLTQPAGPGMAVGSGPGHLALFGYDPLENEIGRGALEALGVDFDLLPQDVAARGNFCTLNENDIITDRRAGRLPTDASRVLAALLRSFTFEGVQVFIEPIKEHRFAFIMRGDGLEADLSETDPQTVGVAPLPVRALTPESEKAARVANAFVAHARQVLRSRTPANAVMLRGFARLPVLPTFAERYGLHAAAIAVNGMYRGVSRLAGMDVLPIPGVTPADQLAVLEQQWQNYDFFYIHIKKTDTYGEMGDFHAKVQAIEEIDALIPRILALQPDVLVVGGDHSSPAVLKAHSWHPVPLLMYGKYVRPDGIAEFGERACLRGSLGVFPAKHILPIALANAGRVAKFGA